MDRRFRSCWDIEEELQRMTDKTNQEKIEYLFQVIEEELAKPRAQIDDVLIYHCQRHIDVLGEKDAFDLSDEALDRAWAEMKVHLPARPSVRRKRFSWRRAIVIAAAVLLLVTTMLTVIAHTGGYGSLCNYLVHLVHKTDPGDSVTKGGLTFINRGEATKYDSIEELLAAEELDIMYPTELPDGLYIEKIKIIEGSNDISFVFNSFDTNIVIHMNPKMNITDGNYTACETNDNTFYVFQKETGEYVAVCYTPKHEYVIMAKNYKNLQTLMEYMRGTENDY